MSGFLPERCGYCGTPFPGGSGRDHFTCPSCSKPNGSVLIGPRNPPDLDMARRSVDRLFERYGTDLAEMAR